MTEFHMDRAAIEQAMDEQRKREAAYLARPLIEITEDEKEYFLNCLPPMHWTTHEGVKVFCMSELQTGDVTMQVGERNGRFFTKYVDHRKRQTWMTATEVDAYVDEDARRDHTNPMPKSAKLVIQNALKAHPNLMTIPPMALEVVAEELHSALYYAGKLKDG